MAGLTGKRVGARNRVAELRESILSATGVEQVTLTGDLAYTLPGVRPNRVHSVVFTQDGTGGHTVTFGGSPLTIDTAPNAATMVEFWPVSGGYRVVYPGAASVPQATFAQGEATRVGTPLALSAAAWTLNPSGTGAVSEGLDPAVGRFVTVATTNPSSVYRMGMPLAQPYGGGRFVSFLLRRDNANATILDLWGSLGVSNLDVAARWNKGISNLDVGRWYRVVLSVVEQGWAGSVEPPALTKLDLRAFTIQVTANADGAASISVADFRVHQAPTTRGRVAIITDDGQADTYTEMYPRLAAHGWAAGVAMEYANVGTSGYCTQAQLDTLYAAGWDMYGHARTDMTTASEATQRATHEAARAWLAANHYERGARIWVWPGGLRNADTEAIAADYWHTMRRVASLTETGAPHVYDPTDPPLYYLTKNKGLSTITAKIDDIAETGLSMVLVLHKLVASPVATEDVSIATFEGILSHLAAANVDVVPASELWTR